MPQTDAVRAQLRSALKWIVDVAEGQDTANTLPTIAKIARRALAESQSPETSPFTGPDTFR